MRAVIGTDDRGERYNPAFHAHAGSGSRILAPEPLFCYGARVATLGTGFLVAVVASVTNHRLSTLISTLAIDQAQIPGAIRQLMIYASVLGNDLGPKRTPIGNLAALFRLHVLALARVSALAAAST